VQLTNAAPCIRRVALTNRRNSSASRDRRFFNSFARKLPVALCSRAPSPDQPLSDGACLTRPLKTPADLKGKIIAIDQTGTEPVLRIAQNVAGAGMTLADVQVKFLPFSEQRRACNRASICPDGVRRAGRDRR